MCRRSTVVASASYRLRLRVNNCGYALMVDSSSYRLRLKVNNSGYVLMFNRSSYILRVNTSRSQRRVDIGSSTLKVYNRNLAPMSVADQQ